MEHSSDTSRLEELLPQVQRNQNMPQHSSGQRPRKRSKGRVAILIIISAIVLMLIGSAAYALWYSSVISNNIALNADEQKALNTVLTPTESNKEPFYVLIVGVDTASYLDGTVVHGSQQGSDIIVLTRIDPATHTVTMVSIPRDTPVYVDGQKTKINSLYLSGGSAATVRAVSQLTGVSIAHYVKIDMAGLVNFIDDIGGVSVDVPKQVTYGNITVKAGMQTLDGRHTLALACSRLTYGDNPDAKRQTVVRSIIANIINSIIKAPTNEIPGMVERFSECVSTDLALPYLVTWAIDFSRADLTLYTCSGPYEGDIDTNNGNLWFCYEDPEGWATLMAQVNAGQDPVAEVATVN